MKMSKSERTSNQITITFTNSNSFQIHIIFIFA